MERRFRPVDRDQQFLLPPDVREWLPAGHPALFVVEVVERLDLSGFVAANRSSRDRGRPAYHPEVMVGIALYASMTSVMSSRRIERLLATDAGFRVVASNERPDHGTICRFLARHRDGLADVFDQVVGMAAEAGLVDPTLVAVDGTKIAGDASAARNERLGDLRARYRGWADQVAENDAAEQAEHDDGGPVPEMTDRDSMRAWIEQRLRERRGDADDARMNTTDPDSGLLPRSGGGWCQGYNAQAAAVPGGIVVAADVSANPADSTQLANMASQVAEAIEAATGEHAGVLVGDAGYWDTETIERLTADPSQPDPLIATGRKIPTEAPAALAEPDMAAYEAAIAEHGAMVEAERRRRIEVIARVVAGELLLREAAELLGLSVPRVFELKKAWLVAGGPDGIPNPTARGNPKLAKPKRPRPPSSPTRARHAMDTRLASPSGHSFYRQRKAIIEPVFGDIKTNRRITRFYRRGIDRVRTEWQWILTGHNLTILHLNTA